MALAPTKGKTSNAGIGLGFQASGIVKKVYVRVGDHVAAGDRLAELDSSLLTARLHEAQATVDIQTATLARLQAGSSAGDIAIAQSKVDIAQANLDEIRGNLLAAVLDAFTKADDAVRAKADQVFTNPKTAPQFTLVADIQTQSDMNARRLFLESLMTTWKNSLMNVGSGDDPTSYLAPTENNVIQVRNFLGIIANVLNGSYQDSVNSATTIRNWRFDISTARANIETALKNLWAAEGKSQSAQFSLALAQADLKQKKQSASPATLAFQAAKISEAQAKVEVLQANINEMSLIAPLAGTISRIKVQAGSMPKVSSPVIYIK